MARLRLAVGNTVLADSSDGVTRFMRLTKPDLNFANDSVAVVGARFARHIRRASGVSFEVNVVVGRQFKTYNDAEIFTLRHIAELSAGLCGTLDYRGVIGTRIGFSNAVLSGARITSEIGLFAETEYTFACGGRTAFPYAIEIGGYILSVDGKIPVVKE